MSAEDDFGDMSVPWVPPNEHIATALYQYICEAGLPHTGSDPTRDHGHIQCFWIGLAIQRLEGRDLNHEGAS